MSVPEEFIKVLKDLIKDIKLTFSEYLPLINKWWKDPSFFNYIDNEEERKHAIQKSDEESIQFAFEFCKKKIPQRFFDILNQNDEIFKQDTEVDTEFLPYIHFKDLWSFDLSQKTRDTIWKYLQLILFSLVGSLESKEAFGDTAKLFESINEEEFKNKLQETLKNMENMFDISGNFDNINEDFNTNINMEDMPNANDIHDHITTMLNGKLGKIAKEIAEETANDLNLDMENCNNMQDVLSNLIKNPTKIMSLVKSVGDKLDTSIKSGEIKESEIMTEATEIMNKMKNMPGMGNISSMLNKMGLNKMGGKFNTGAMEAQLNKNTQMAKIKERCRAKAEMNRVLKEKIIQEHLEKQQNNVQKEITEEQLISIFTSGEKPEKTPRNNNKKKIKHKK
jgi:hypothetical protein